MKIQEVLEKIKEMSLFEKLDFLMKIYDQVEDKKSLEDLINKTVEQISSERTPVFINVEFKKQSESQIEKKVMEESRETEENEKEQERRRQEYIEHVKFIESEDETFWVGERVEKKYEQSYKPPERKKYKVVW